MHTRKQEIFRNFGNEKIMRLKLIIFFFTRIHWFHAYIKNLKMNENIYLERDMQNKLFKLLFYYI